MANNFSKQLNIIILQFQDAPMIPNMIITKKITTKHIIMKSLKEAINELERKRRLYFNAKFRQIADLPEVIEARGE